MAPESRRSGGSLHLHNLLGPFNDSRWTQSPTTSEIDAGEPLWTPPSSPESTSGPSRSDAGCFTPKLWLGSSPWTPGGPVTPKTPDAHIRRGAISAGIGRSTTKLKSLHLHKIANREGQLTDWESAVHVDGGRLEDDASRASRSDATAATAIAWNPFWDERWWDELHDDEAGAMPVRPLYRESASVVTRWLRGETGQGRWDPDYVEDDKEQPEGQRWAKGQWNAGTSDTCSADWDFSASLPTSCSPSPSSSSSRSFSTSTTRRHVTRAYGTSPRYIPRTSYPAPSQPSDTISTPSPTADHRLAYDLSLDIGLHVSPTRTSRSPTRSRQRVHRRGTAVDAAVHLQRSGRISRREEAEVRIAGLSMYLFCPKKRVTRRLEPERLERLRAGMKELEIMEPGIRDRTVVHAHETINIAAHSSMTVTLAMAGGSSAPTEYEDMAKSLRYDDSAETSEMGDVTTCALPILVGDQTLQGLDIEMQTLQALGLRYLLVHPGSDPDGDMLAGEKRAAGHLDILLARHPGITIVLESMTCKASNTRMLGTTLASLCRIRTHALPRHRSRIMFCLDLAHLHACPAGYDLSDPTGRASLFADVDRCCEGGRSVAFLHVSESGVPHGDGRDRHATFGEGFTGDPAIRAILRHPLFRHTISIIETPRFAPHGRSSGRIDALETARLALDWKYLRNLTSLSDESWARERGRIREERERAVRNLRRRVGAAVRAEGAGGSAGPNGRWRRVRGMSIWEGRDVGVQRSRRRRRGLLGLERRKGQCGEGWSRSPRREREQEQARARYWRRRRMELGVKSEDEE